MASWSAGGTDRWARAGDVALFVLASAAAILIMWMVVRLDARSARLEQLVEARATPCLCATPARP